MSWWVKLVSEKDNRPVSVPRFEDGGTYPLGGTTDADLNITYNYSPLYHTFLDKEEGLRWLHGKSGKDGAPRLEAAVRELGIDGDEDYWKPTRGNAGRALIQLLLWAEKHPDAIFRVD